MTEAMKEAFDRAGEEADQLIEHLNSLIEKAGQAAIRIREWPSVPRFPDLIDVMNWAMPLLDQTPIDEEWLLSMGFEEELHDPFPAEYRIRFKELPANCDAFAFLKISAPTKDRRDWGFHATVGGGGCWPGPLTTRGHVCRLALSLGVELTAKELD